MSDTLHLQLPYLAASQAQKHVTHNEALSLLDGLVQAAVKSRVIATPPASPENGDRYLVAASPTGAWAGQAGKLALRMDGQWRFLSPVEGWAMWVDDEDVSISFNGTSWLGAGTPTELQNLNLLGVNATANSGNKLTVASAATLFNNVGNGHQIKINKNVAGDTASILYQTGFSGRAEFGTTGDDDFHVKVSSDGTTFHEAIVVSAASGLVTAKKTLRLEPQAADPAAPVDGQLWYNSTSNSFRKRQNGATSDLDSAGGGGATWGTITGTLSAQTDLQTALSGKSAVGHTHLLANVTDVTMTVANLNALDDGLNTALHFHDADRARGNHTGTQAAATISDFNAAADARVTVGINTHVAAGDPHPQYLTATEGNAAYSALGHAHSGLVPVGGAAGQVLKKNSATDFDYAWAADATGSGGMTDGDKGDIVVSGGGIVWSVDIAGQTEDTAPAFDDFILTEDTSASTRKKVKGENIRKLFEGSVKLAADFVSSVVTLADVPGMNFTAAANTEYIVEVIGTFQTVATTTGMAAALNIPSGDIVGLLSIQNAATTASTLSQTADNATSGASAGVIAINTSQAFEARWYVRVGAAGGPVSLAFRSEVAASNATLKAAAAGTAGTIMTWRKV